MSSKVDNSKAAAPAVPAAADAANKPAGAKNAPKVATIAQINTALFSGWNKTVDLSTHDSCATNVFNGSSTFKKVMYVIGSIFTVGIGTAFVELAWYVSRARNGQISNLTKVATATVALDVAKKGQVARMGSKELVAASEQLRKDAIAAAEKAGIDTKCAKNVRLIKSALMTQVVFARATVAGKNGIAINADEEIALSSQKAIAHAFYAHEFALATAKDKKGNFPQIDTKKKEDKVVDALARMAYVGVDEDGEIVRTEIPAFNEFTGKFVKGKTQQLSGVRKEAAETIRFALELAKVKGAGSLTSQIEKLEKLVNGGKVFKAAVKARIEKMNAEKEATKVNHDAAKKAFKDFDLKALRKAKGALAQVLINLKDAQRKAAFKLEALIAKKGADKANAIVESYKDDSDKTSKSSEARKWYKAQDKVVAAEEARDQAIESVNDLQQKLVDINGNENGLRTFTDEDGVQEVRQAGPKPSEKELAKQGIFKVKTRDADGKKVRIWVQLDGATGKTLEAEDRDLTLPVLKTAKKAMKSKSALRQFTEAQVKTEAVEKLSKLHGRVQAADRLRMGAAPVAPGPEFGDAPEVHGSAPSFGVSAAGQADRSEEADVRMPAQVRGGSEVVPDMQAPVPHSPAASAAASASAAAAPAEERRVVRPVRDEATRQAQLATKWQDMAQRLARKRATAGMAAVAEQMTTLTAMVGAAVGHAKSVVGSAPVAASAERRAERAERRRHHHSRRRNKDESSSSSSSSGSSSGSSSSSRSSGSSSGSSSSSSESEARSKKSKRKSK